MKEKIKNFYQFFKYCIVGVIGTFLDLFSLYIFVEYFHLNVLIASTFSFLIAVTNNFIFNKTWTFKNKSKNFKKLYIKFLIVSTVGLGLTLFCMFIFVNILHIWYMLAKAMTSLIVLTWNFLGNKLWTFKLKEQNLNIPNNFKFKFSIIIPAYNEENRIKETLSKIDDYLKLNRLNAEIIVVNDGSTDKTSQTVKAFQETIKNLKLSEYSKNEGKGFAVKSGIEKSSGEFILFADADNSTPIEELDNLYDCLLKTNSQIAIGSRYMPSSKVKIAQPKYRILLGRMGNLLIRLFLIDNIKDTQCGFKLFTHEAAKKIFSFQKVKRFGFDMEALVIANNLDYKIIEIPVSWYNSKESRIRPIKDALITLKDLIYIKLNLWSGRYS